MRQKRSPQGPSPGLATHPATAVSNQQIKSRHPPLLQGTAGPNVTFLRAVESRKYLHLWNMESNVDEVHEYLQQLCPGKNCTVEQLKSRGTNHIK
ncbi:unnamed protein product [Leptosia nina]|uniref:Uncharacterized protein n=1 Tax=Leptosia nina TaxID=320188 RepID=A0AAV1JAI7_9NEOP